MDLSRLSMIIIIKRNIKFVGLKVGEIRLQKKAGEIIYLTTELDCFGSNVQVFK